KIRACHGAFAVDVRAEKGGAERFELGHDVLGTQFEGASPSVGNDASFFGVEREDDFASGNFCSERAKERHVGFAVTKGGAADEDLFGAGFCERDCALESANAASNSNSQAVVSVSLGAEFADQLVVVTFAQGGIEIDDVQPFVVTKFVKQAENVFDG